MCSFPGYKKEKAATSKEFEIMVGNAEQLDWKYGTSPPNHAVNCDLEQGGSGDCFLGQGVYSDGICEEVGIILETK